MIPVINEDLEQTKKHKEKFIRFHKQNLNDRKDGTTGSILRFGRCWLNVGKVCFNFEWNFFKHTWFGLAFETGGCEQDFQINIHYLIGSLYLTIRDLFPYNHKMMDRTWESKTGFTFYNENCSLTLWFNCQDNVWPHKKGWSKSFYLLDIIFGRHVYTKEIIKKIEAEVPMPEKPYPCTIELERCTWKRPRWPFTKYILTANVEVEGGIPHPGKGTTAYNCGDDATYSIGCEAKDEFEAIGKYVETVLRDRKRYPL